MTPIWASYSTPDWVCYLFAAIVSQNCAGIWQDGLGKKIIIYAEFVRVHNEYL
ncbi:hypothetical protein NIES39_D07460 [Arthrospira platensis NIES-39]|nr:hypothetical protein NIES39_D07460 [Arthrospira platensis NIES-39]